MADQRHQNLSDVFKCFICMEKLRDARICPQCSKLCCYQCIRRWLNEQRPQCPHCRTKLALSDMVKCRWAEEVTQYIDGLNTAAAKDDAEKCPIHQEKQTVYCWPCQACICHYCALWGENHSGHTLKPLEEVYDDKVGQIHIQVRALRKRLTEIIHQIQSIEQNVDLLRGAKEERVREIRCCVELMISRLDAEMKEKLIRLINQKVDLSTETEMLESFLRQVEAQLEGLSKADLLRKADALTQVCAKIQRKTLPAFNAVPCDFTSELVPPFRGHVFKVSEFTKLRLKTDPVYSPILACDGLEWRLKVYPDGNGIVRGNYLSVFLELTTGQAVPGKYEYRIEMINQSAKPAMGNVVRAFASEFEVGECWGFNRFFKLDLLATEGFLDLETDSIDLQFKVRPPTYFQKARDLEWYVSQLEASRLHDQKQLTSLKRASQVVDPVSSVPNIPKTLLTAKRESIQSETSSGWGYVRGSSLDILVNNDERSRDDRSPPVGSPSHDDGAAGKRGRRMSSLPNLLALHSMRETEIKTGSTSIGGEKDIEEQEIGDGGNHDVDMLSQSLTASAGQQQPMRAGSWTSIAEAEEKRLMDMLLQQHHEHRKSNKGHSSSKNQSNLGALPSSSRQSSLQGSAGAAGAPLIVPSAVSSSSSKPTSSLHLKMPLATSSPRRRRHAGFRSSTAAGGGVNGSASGTSFASPSTADMVDRIQQAFRMSSLDDGLPSAADSPCRRHMQPQPNCARCILRDEGVESDLADLRKVLQFSPSSPRSQPSPAAERAARMSGPRSRSSSTERQTPALWPGLRPKRNNFLATDMGSGSSDENNPVVPGRLTDSD